MQILIGFGQPASVGYADEKIYSEQMPWCATSKAVCSYSIQ